MQLESVVCVNCGAPLQIPAGVEFVTCNHCHGHLTIRRTDSVSYTELVEQIDQRTQQMAEDIAGLRRDAALAELDRDWEREQASFRVRGNEGREYDPTTGGAIATGVITTVAGIVWMAFASGIGGGGFALLGLVFIAFGIGASVYAYSRATAKEQAYQQYLRRRREIQDCYAESRGEAET